ncbi:hypothetical protein C8R45DRAFT_782512, partial [Mycena sanguinolenta]
DLWFADHNLVLQAGNRQFRVSGGILAARSSVFRDMLSIPQPHTKPLVDGCPVVVLHDAPADAEYFLKAIFDSGMQILRTAPALFNFHVVAGILRLSTKYDVEYLRHRALLHLSAALPGSLAEHDSRDRIGPFDAEEEVELPLLILAHELGLTWALPTALYFVSGFTVEHILDGITFNGRDIELPRSVQRTLSIGRSSLAISQVRHMLKCLR